MFNFFQYSETLREVLIFDFKESNMKFELFYNILNILNLKAENLKSKKVFQAVKFMFEVNNKDTRFTLFLWPSS